MSIIETSYYKLEFNPSLSTLTYCSKDFHMDRDVKSMIMDIIHMLKKHTPRFYVSDLENLSVLGKDETIDVVTNVNKAIIESDIELVYVIPPKKKLQESFYNKYVSLSKVSGYLPHFVEAKDMNSALDSIKEINE